VDRFVTDTWYSNNLVQALSKLCPIHYYADVFAPKKKHVKPFWHGIFFPFQIVRESIRDGVNVVHLQFELNMFGRTVTNLAFPFLLFFLRLVRKKVIVTLHGVIPYELFKSKKITEIVPTDVVFPPSILKIAMFCVYGSISKLSNKMIVHSPIFKKWLLQYRINTQKIDIIPHGISTDRKVSMVKKWKDFGSRIVLNFGVITPRKGLETLISAFANLDVDDAKLVIAGREMPYYVGYFDKIKELVKKHGIEDRVLFTGFLPDKEVHYLFEKAEIVVIPYHVCISASGVLSYAVQHAKPTIVTETEFFMEELSRSESLFVPVDDVNELKNAMEQLLKNGALKNEFSKQIALKAKANNWEKVAQKHLEVYRL